MAFHFLLTSLTILACSWSCHADLVAEICLRAEICDPSITITPTTCARTLRSNSRSRGADLGTLGQIAIKNAKVAVKDTATVAKAVGDLNNTGAVSMCTRVCSSVIDDLNTIAGMLKNSSKHNKTEIFITLSRAITLIETCDEAFMKDVGSEPAEVGEASSNANGLIFVVQTIAAMFPYRKMEIED